MEEQNALCAVYIRRLELVFSLDLYAPMGEPEVCLTLFDRLAQAVCLGGPEGLTCGELSCGDLTYDNDSRTLTCPARLSCQAGCALYQTEEGEVFTDFVVKGELIS
ncbi:MAG: hypothetical protein LUD79_02835 [Oscillospiraceae bacterium]|nr:hypothetical protein [Oscillospiraceae bacterium]